MAWIVPDERNASLSAADRIGPVGILPSRRTVEPGVNGVPVPAAGGKCVETGADTEPFAVLSAAAWTRPVPARMRYRRA
jgi:hypothetical protein